MFNSLKKWVQDKAVDFTPPTQPSPSSPSFLSSSSSQSGSAHHYYYHHPTTPSYEQQQPQQYNDRLSPNPSISNRSFSRPISTDSVQSSQMVNTSAISPASVELDLSHLNREEQEHIANVLRRARAVDEQQSSIPPIVMPSKPSPSASIVTASLSPSASSSSSSSTSTSSFNSEKSKRYDENDKTDNNDDNEICEDEELPRPPSPESTLITIHRCQVCNKEQQQQENTTFCFQCQDDDEVARVTENNTIPLIAIRKSSSPIPMESNDYEEDKIADNAIRIDQPNSPIQEYASYITDQYTEKMNANQGQEENQLRQSPTLDSQIRPTLFLVKTRSNNLTEIDEDDFFYQGPSPYSTQIDINQISETIEDLPVLSYKIDEFIDEDDNNERDHVKELEETIANISRHFPLSSEQINDNEINLIERNLHQSSSLSHGKIDIDSILEMEIESPSTDKHFIQSSTSIPTSSQHPVTIPITIPIVVSNRRGSLSRSSGVREHLTDLLTPETESFPIDDRLLQRTSSINSKRVIQTHRQKRNLPSVPLMINHLQLRRANSESRFRLPAVPPPIIITNSNLDDENDLLEIDLNDPTGSINRTIRSKTESELINSNDINYHIKSFHSTNQSPSVDQLSSTKKQSRDQTTNTPPISNLNATNKIKKKLKKKGSSPSINTNGHHTNGQLTPTGTSPIRKNPPAVVLSSSSPPMNRLKLQKSTSTEISYPFPVSKLILSRDNLNPSRRDGTDLGLRITGGHSIPNCMEVAACIERIDTHHRNYHILKNAVQEGDEVLEVGGVSLRGKSALFVQNLMHSIENEFELVVRSQHILPPPIEIHKPEKFNTNIQSQNMLTVSSLTVDPNISRRHSMDTSQSVPTHPTNNTVVKSQSIIMSLPINNSNNLSEEFLSPTLTRKKSVSSKERLFSVESLHRTLSTKSNEQLIKVIPPSLPETYSNKYDEQNQTSLTITTPENKILPDDSTIVSQRRRTYEPRNSLFPNDPRLNGSGSNPSIERRSSNESDESDNLSQYFRSPSSRKSSLITTNDLTNNPNPGLSHERSQSITPSDNEAALDASRRLQNFLKSKDEKRVSGGSVGDNTMNLNKTEERKSSSGLSSFQFLKKKPKSVDLPNQPTEVRENDYVGDIELQIGHDSEREQLVLRIIQAHNLLAKDTNGYSDPFVKVYLLPGRDQENKRRTKYISKNLNPIWDHTVIYGNMHREELQYKMLEFTVWDYDRFKANDFLGQITIDLKDTNVIDDKPHWYRLQALRSREESTNRGSSPRLYQMTSTESTASSTLTLNKNTVNMQSRINQRK